MQAFFNDNPAADNFGRVKDQLAEVKDVMVDNIGERSVRRDPGAMPCSAGRALGARSLCRLFARSVTRTIAVYPLQSAC